MSADDFAGAANIFLAMHDFDLATRYFLKAQQGGASPDIVSIGLANTYLAEGKTKEAQETLATLGADYRLRGGWSLVGKLDGQFASSGTIVAAQASLRKTW